MHDVRVPEGAVPAADIRAVGAVVVIGGSAGALEPLMQLLAQLPGDIPAAFVVVVHTPATSANHLARILGRHTALHVETAEDGSALEEGLVLVAPADHHVVITPGAVRLTRSPRENGHRPAIDPLFRSASQVFGRHVTGIVLCGLLDDGSAGLAAIKACGGATIVADPTSCTFSDMPENAIRVAQPDHVVAAAAMAPLLEALSGGVVSAKPLMARRTARPSARGASLGAPGGGEPDRDSPVSG